MSTFPDKLYHAWASSDPQDALELAGLAPGFLKSQPANPPSFPASIFSRTETADLWLQYEQLFLACLRVGDDQNALECLRRLTRRFGAANERIMGLQGLYDEAKAENKGDLLNIVKRYRDALRENPVNLPIAKRLVALLRSLSRQPEAIETLVKLLESFPTDGEAWVELSDLYFSQGLVSQAIFCLEEALLTAPNAWNLHARMGTLEYASASSKEGSASLTLLGDSVRRFCRSIELCDDYIRGYYGLKQSTKLMIERYPQSPVEGLQPKETLEKLHKLATTKIGQIAEARSLDNNKPQIVNDEVLAIKKCLGK